MAIGKRKPIQQRLFVSTASLDLQPHPFYAAVNKVLDVHHFTTFAEELCAKFYDDPAKGGRPGLSPAVYFRCLMLGIWRGSTPARHRLALRPQPIGQRVPGHPGGQADAG